MKLIISIFCLAIISLNTTFACSIPILSYDTTAIQVALEEVAKDSSLDQFSVEVLNVTFDAQRNVVIKLQLLDTGVTKTLKYSVEMDTSGSLIPCGPLVATKIL